MRIRLSPTVVERYMSNPARMGLLTLLYAPLLLHWVDGWLRKSISIEHEYFSHGIIGLPFAAYVVWMNRKQWQRIAENDRAIGLEKFIGTLLLLVAGVFYLSGLPDFVNLSLPCLLTGICLW
ncbi:MAG: archaeosortase/exosortase family protein, partial [Phormidesmis sp. CAN_BIN44]|nr:archaeosortase/exosortase family protein [Phormidesmis sp. CAN_BIN44]